MKSPSGRRRQKHAYSAFGLCRPGVALRRFAQDFDLCLIDTPPPGSLAAADFVVTPVSVGLYVADSEAKYNLLNIFGSVKE